MINPTSSIDNQQINIIADNIIKNCKLNINSAKATIHVNKNLSNDIGDASTIDNYNNNSQTFEIEITIGIKPRTKNPTYQDLTNLCVSIFHEFGHVNQILEQFDKNNKLSMVLCSNHYARKASLDYYDCNNIHKTNNYIHHPSEIAAQYVGIKNAYAYLSQLYDKTTANLLLCDYAEHTNTVGFIKPQKYENISDIAHAYKNAFNDAIHLPRIFKPEFKICDQNFTYEITNKAKESLYKNTSGLKKDIILATAYFTYSPEGYQFSKGQKQNTFPPSFRTALSRINIENAKQFIIPKLQIKGDLLNDIKYDIDTAIIDISTQNIDLDDIFKQ